MRAVVLHNVIDAAVDPFDRAVSRLPARRFSALVDAWHRDYEIVDWATAMRGLAHPRPARTPLLLTFDDGFAGVHDVALPVLSALGLVATAFVLTDAGAPIPADQLLHFEHLELAFRHTAAETIDLAWLGLGVQRLGEPVARVRALRDVKRALKTRDHAARAADTARLFEALGTNPAALGGVHARDPRYRKMDGTEIRTLLAAGWTVGGHTRTHPILSRADDRALADEVGGNARDLEEAFGVSGAPFAYPSGGPAHIDARAEAAVREAGFSCAFTTTPGDNDAGTHPFRLRRFSPTDLQVRVLGWGPLGPPG